jgi:hypothetical protein
MAETLIGPDGGALALDADAAEQAFHAAMAAPEPGDSPDYPAPPRKDTSAPYGRKADGTPHAKPGRKPRTAADKPRTARNVPEPPAKPGGKGTGSQPVTTDYSAMLADFGQAVWMGLASIGPTRAYAAVWKMSLPAEVQAWNQAAQQNATVRGYVEKLAAGPTWVVGVAIATAPLFGGVVAVLRDPGARAQLARQTEEDFTAFLKANMPAEPEPEKAAA